jgi:hypothetical protein
MKKLVFTALIAAFAMSGFAGETKKCDPANCKDKACAQKDDKKACKDGKACKDKKACEAMKKEAASAAPKA